jgi:hypothetical protein
LSGTPFISATLRAALYREEDRIRHDTVETAIVFDLRGNELFRRTGDEQAVDFSDDELALMRDAILTHNHPIDLPFSYADLELASVNDLAMIRAVSPGFRHALWRPTGGWPKVTVLRAVYFSAYRKVEQRYRVEELLGTMARDETRRYAVIGALEAVVQRFALLYIREQTW